MVERYINAALVRLVEKSGYMPIKIEDNNMLYGSKILFKNYYDRQLYVDLINADAMSAEQIAGRLEINKNILANTASDTVFYYTVFIFRNGYDREKMNIIESRNQQSALMQKKFLCCITVDLQSRQVNTLLKVSTGGLDKVLGEVLSSDYDLTAPSDVSELIERSRRDYKISFVTNTPWFTYIFIAVNVIIYVLLQYLSMTKGVSYEELLLRFGAKDNMLILQGDYWRLLTPVFLHANIVHLAVNCYSLYVIGVITEKLYGNAKFLFVYIIAGILGNIASFAFSTNWSVGASGSLFGLMGALLYYGVENPKQFRRYFASNLIINLAINIAYGFTNQGIDIYAHFGGLTGGFFAAGIVKLKGTAPKFLGRVTFVIITVLLFIGMLYYGFSSVR